MVTVRRHWLLLAVVQCGWWAAPAAAGTPKQPAAKPPTVAAAKQPAPAAGKSSVPAAGQPATAPVPPPEESKPADIKPAEIKAAGDSLLLPSLRFDRITGMTKGAVSAIAQDSSGLIWFGTEEGLSRYDGYEFVNYVPGGDPDATLSNFTVTALATTSDSLFVGTVKGLDRLNLATNKFTHLKTNPQNANTIASDYIVSLHLGASGLLWIGTADAGVDSMNPTTGEVHHYRSSENRRDALADDAISVVREDKSGKVWVGTREAGLDLLDPQSGKVTHYRSDPDQPTTLTHDKVTALYQDGEGTVWIGTMNGLNKFEPAKGTFKQYLEGREADPTWITSIVEGADGGLWLGVKGIGVYRFDRGSGAVEKYTHDSVDATSISHPWTRCAFSDRGGVLWFGFQAGGVSKLYLMRREFSFYRTDPGLAFFEDGDRLWLGTQGHGLKSLNLKTGEVKSYLDEILSATWTTKIIAGDKGSLWLATTDRGLFHYTPHTGKLDSYDTESGALTSDSVFALLRDNDSLWIGTYGAGLAHLDTTKKTIEYFASAATNPATLSSDYVVAIQPDRANPDLLWVGTPNGLNQFDKRNGKVVRYLHDATKPTSLSSDHVTDIHEDHAGRLWIATWGGGLDRLDRKTGAFTSFHMAQGLASEVVYGILEDKAGILWLTTEDGLSRFDPEKVTSTNFRAGDGLQDDEFGQGGFYQGPSGRFYVGGPRGFNVFVPELLKSDTYVPPVVVTKFEILGDARPIPDAVSLSYRDRVMSVTFAGLSYASSARNRYKVRLKGLDDWVETDRRFANYTSLPPGDYTFEVLASNAHGLWNETGLRLPIHVRPPPWRTWWAYCAYLVFLGIIVFLFLRRQRRQLSALKQAHRLSELEREMALTSAVQEGFFPVEPSVTDGALRLEGFYRSATECSGDWWWYEPRGDSYFILVGDVTGHGAGSAMVTAAVASCFRSLGRRVDDDTRLDEMNEEVLRVSRGQYHMTLTALDINIVTGDYVIRSAGGVPVFSLPPQGRTKVHMCPGMPLGTPEFQLGRLEGRLAPGERILIMTDGIPEVAMANTQIVGPRGVSNFYMQTREQELQVALRQLIQKVEAVQAGTQDDDWTAVMLQWGAAGAARGNADDESQTVQYED
ncbi:MAG: two component regulator propeller domain protein [Myxococcales bacterium]|nr:two component regulator propeller domain protein [Myxococcales bacterium]